MNIALVGYLPVIIDRNSLRKLSFYLVRILLRRGHSVDVIPAFDEEPRLPRSFVKVDERECSIIKSDRIPENAYDAILMLLSPHYLAPSSCASMIGDLLNKLVKSIRQRNPKAKLGLYGTFNSIKPSPPTSVNLSKYFDFLIFYNEYDAKSYEASCAEAGIPTLPHFVVTPGVDTKLYKPVPRESKTKDCNLVLSIVRNALEKNPVAVLAAVSEAKRRGAKLRLLMLTNICALFPYGVLDLSTASHSIGLTDVEFVEEFIEEHRMPEVYVSADIFITLSSTEGVCMPMLEAQACGLPVIAHALPALKSVYGDSVMWVGSEGTLHLPLGPISIPSVSEAAQRLLEAASDEGLRKEFSAKGLANAKRYDWDEAVGPKLETALKSVAE